MDKLNNLLNKDDLLSCIHRYELHRDKERMFIDIREILTPVKKNKFIAMPNLVLGKSNNEYWGAGATKEEALLDCLAKIKGLSISTIFPDPKKK